MSYRQPLATTLLPGTVTVGAGLAITPQGVLSTVGGGGAVGFSVASAVPQITTSVDGTTPVTGLTIIPGAGTYQVSANINYSLIPDAGSITAQAATDVAALAATLAALPGGVPHGAVFGLGEVLAPGVYDTVGAAAIQGVLTLDAAGDPNAVFVIRTAGALTSVAASQVLLINGANPANVFWRSTGATALGAATTFAGTVVATGAAGAGAATIIDGQLLSTTGAITTDTNVVSRPLTVGVIPVGVLQTFALFTAIGNVTNTGTSVITGDIGTNSGVISGYDLPTVVIGNIYPPGAAGVGPVIAQFEVFANGVLVPVSTRVINSDTTIPSNIATLQATATVLAGQAIDVRSTVNTGTLTANNKILSLIQV